MRAIESHIKGDLEIDLPHIRIEQRSVADPLVFVGAGTITHRDGHHLYLKMYGTPEGNRRSFSATIELMKLRGNGVSGKLIPGENYFKLEAIDLAGHVWKAESFLPSTLNGHGGDPAVIVGSLTHLSSTREYGHNVPSEGVKLYFPLHVDFPCNTTTTIETRVGKAMVSTGSSVDTAKFDADGRKFTVHRENEWTVLEVWTEGNPCPPNFEVRLCEALSFSFGYEFNPAIIRFDRAGTTSTTIRSFKGHEKERGNYPPLNSGFYDPSNCFWPLFALYLRKMIEHEGSTWHPLSTHVMSVVRVGRTSFEAQSLVLGIAVEGVLGLEFNKLIEPNPDVIEQVEKLRILIDESDLKPEFKSRVNGTFGGFKRIQPKDKLKELTRLGLINENFHGIWTRVRNSSAHAAMLDPEKIELQLDHCHAVRTLLNQLIFLAIGYQGMHTDYSTPGWPVVMYPHRLPDHKKESPAK